MTSQPSVRLGLLGAARIAPAAVIKPARELDEIQVAAVAARDRGKAEKFAGKHGVPRVCDSYDALLSDEEIDAVYIALPNTHHADWAIRALAAGKHVLCEKPIAANAEEAERMAQAARKSERILCEAVHCRYHPLAERIREIVQSGQMGTIRHIESHLCVPLPFPDDIRYRFDLGGGAVMDVGCYAIHFSRFLAGAEPEVIRASAKLSSPQVDRWMQAELQFPDGCTGDMVCSIFSTILLRSRVVVHGDKGEMRVTNPFMPHVGHRIRVRTGGAFQRERVPGRASYDHQLAAFARAVREGSELPTESADFVANMRVIDAVYEKAGLLKRGVS